MAICKNCKHWKALSHELVTIGAYLDAHSNEDIQTESDIRKKLGFGVRACKHPNIISSGQQSIKRDSLILDMEWSDTRSMKPVFTSEYFGCVNHDKKVMEHL